MNEPQLPAELEKRFDEEISYLLHEMVDGDWCPAFGIPYFNPLESTSATKTKPNYRVVNLVNKCECSGAEKIAKIKHFLATALEEQKMKVEVETGLKNFQITMEEIAKARHDERQKVLAEAVKALDNIFDYGMGREQMLEKFEAELRAKLEEMKGMK